MKASLQQMRLFNPGAAGYTYRVIHDGLSRRALPAIVHGAF
jgi:hypothetical protein